MTNNETIKMVLGELGEIYSIEEIEKEKNSLYAPTDEKHITGYVREENVAYGLEYEKQQGEYTIEDYYALSEDRRMELIDGVLYDMASPTSLHQIIAGSIYDQFYQYIKKNKGNCIPYIAPLDVKLNKDNKTMVQPDVFVMCYKDNEEYIEDNTLEIPDFVLEIISPSSTKRDYIIKYKKYHDTGVREYWIIDPIKEKVTVFDFENDAEPVIYPLSGEIPVKIYSGNLNIDLDEYKEFWEKSKDRKIGFE